MSETPSSTDQSDLELTAFEVQPIRRYPQISWSDWLDEMEPYLERYRELLAEGNALPRRTPWEGTFEL